MMLVTIPRSMSLRKVLLALALSFSALQAAAAPQVVVSIKPLQLIAAAITDGVTTPVVVWAQGQDPHHVSLRPSERRLLAGADLILWTGPMLEQPLTGLVDALDARILTVQDLAGLTLIDVDGHPDPHVWTDTRNARLIAAALAAALTELDPAHTPQYRANAARFSATLDTLNVELRTQLADAGQRDWAVYHHALRYMEQEFGLLPPLTLADNENNAPGLRTAVQVREQLRQKQITCMLTEPGVNHDEVLTMLDLPALQLVDADVMGRGAAVSDYATYLRTLATTLRECLGAAR